MGMAQGLEGSWCKKTVAGLDLCHNPPCDEHCMTILWANMIMQGSAMVLTNDLDQS